MGQKAKRKAAEVKEHFLAGRRGLTRSDEGKLSLGEPERGLAIRPTTVARTLKKPAMGGGGLSIKKKCRPSGHRRTSRLCNKNSIGGRKKG